MYDFVTIESIFFFWLLDIEFRERKKETIIKKNDR